MDDAETRMCRAAKARAVVKLDDGRQGRLVYWPGGNRGRQGGRRPKIMLPSGAFIAVDMAAVVEVEEVDNGDGEALEMSGVRDHWDCPRVGPAADSMP